MAGLEAQYYCHEIAAHDSSERRIGYAEFVAGHDEHAVSQVKSPGEKVGWTYGELLSFHQLVAALALAVGRGAQHVGPPHPPMVAFPF